MFSFNAPFGACPACNGLGFTQKIDPNLIIDYDLSILDGALSNIFASMEYTSYYRQVIDALAEMHKVDLNTKFRDLPDKFKKELLYGTGSKHLVYDYTSKSTGQVSHRDHPFEGVINNLERRYRETSSDFMKARLEKYMVRCV